VKLSYSLNYFVYDNIVNSFLYFTIKKYISISKRNLYEVSADKLKSDPFRLNQISPNL